MLSLSRVCPKVLSFSAPSRVRDGDCGQGLRQANLGEKDLQAYYRGTQFFGRLYPVKLANAKENAPSTPAPMFDVKLALADLTNRPGREVETRKTLEDLTREDPKRPEPWIGLGYLAWRDNKVGDAADFGKPTPLGIAIPRFFGTTDAWRSASIRKMRSVPSLIFRSRSRSGWMFAWNWRPCI